MSDSSSRGSRHVTALAALAVVFSLVIIYAGHQVTTSPRFWGGTVCGDPGQWGIKACTGYPPTGLFLAILAGVVLASLSVNLVERLLRSAA